MPRPLRFLPVFCLAALTLIPLAKAAEEPVVVQAPPEGSDMKLFEFAGGTPEQLIAELRKTFGPFRATVVMMTDQTGGEPLPALKVFAGDAEAAIRSGLKGRAQLLFNSNVLTLRFIGASQDPSAEVPPGSEAGADAKSEKKKSVHFRFPGGTPMELVAKLDNDFGTQLAAVATVAPDISGIRLPVLQMKVTDAAEVIGLLNEFSQQSAGSCGYWAARNRAGEEVDMASDADILIITPLYNERNPSPAVIGMNTASSPEMRTIRELEKKTANLESNLNSANSTLQQVQEQLKLLQSKTP